MTSEDAAAIVPYHAIGYAGDVVMMAVVEAGIAAIRVARMRHSGPSKGVRFLAAGHGGRMLHNPK